SCEQRDTRHDGGDTDILAHHLPRMPLVSKTSDPEDNKPSAHEHFKDRTFQQPSDTRHAFSFVFIGYWHDACAKLKKAGYFWIRTNVPIQSEKNVHERPRPSVFARSSWRRKLSSTRSLTSLCRGANGRGGRRSATRLPKLICAVRVMRPSS